MNIFKWFQAVVPVSVGETPTSLVARFSVLGEETSPALSHGSDPMTAPQTVPKRLLPHLAPRDELIARYVTGPRRSHSVKQAPLKASPYEAEPTKVLAVSENGSGRPSSTHASFSSDARNASSPSAPFTAQPPVAPPTSSSADTARLAASARTLEELRTIVSNFEGCPLKALATHTVFSDGNPQANVMFVGEAPGADEDAKGLPFVGISGQLLDRMMKAIGLDRTSAYIGNIVPWRPPGNRQPSPAEISLCLPFIQRQIELAKPEILVLVGGTAVKSLLGRNDGITKLRGQWYPYQTQGLGTPIKAMATFHPAYLLRSPGQKREAWRDLLMIQDALSSR